MIVDEVWRHIIATEMSKTDTVPDNPVAFKGAIRKRIEAQHGITDDRILELVDRYPGAPVVWHNKGALLYGPLDRREEALVCFREEVKLDSKRWFDLEPAIREQVPPP